MIGKPHSIGCGLSYRSCRCLPIPQKALSEVRALFLCNIYSKLDSVQISENGKLIYPGTAATPNYIPTELYKYGIGKSEEDVLTTSWDQFALGVVFYQLLFGLHPYVVTPYVSRDSHLIHSI